MDELKLLIEMVANLPQMALWVLVGFWAYKVIVIGSIYGLVRFIVLYIYRMYTTGKVKDGICRIESITMGDCVLSDLIVQIKRTSNRSFIYEEHVEWLKQAIDDKQAKDAAEKAEKKTTFSSILK